MFKKYQLRSLFGSNIGLAIMKTPPQQATGYQKEDDPEPARSKLRGIAPKEIEIGGDESGQISEGHHHE